MSINNNQPQSPLEYPANDQIPVRIFRRNRAPLTTDYRNFKIRDFWNDTSQDVLWYLTSKTTTSGLWINLGGGGEGGITWNEETGTSATMIVENGYIANNAGLITLTLPATASVGERIQVDGKGAGGWLIAQNADQTVHFLAQDTTAGTGGSIASTRQYDCITYRCITDNTDWVVETSTGVFMVI